jgi:glycerate kinase
MRVLVAFDKFKDALTARQTGEVVARVLRARHPEWTLDLCPLTDGGEGFAEILTRAAGGSLSPVRVAGPRGAWIEAPVGWVSWERVPAAARDLLDLGTAITARGDARLAVVEMAAASGLALLDPASRDPWRTTSRGTGQLIRAAAEMGASAVLLGIGGSATHDLGLGALDALGLEFRAADGSKLRPPVPALWSELARIEGDLFASIPPIRIACDVTNPVLGPEGAAAVYAPQKGLAPGDFARLEEQTGRMVGLLCDHCDKPRTLAQAQGAGAAGGIAFGLMAAARARLVSGNELTFAWLDLDSRLRAADWVITGEGRYDASSLKGKGPGALVAQALRLGKTAHVFAGEIGLAPDPGGAALHSITPPGTPRDQALRRAADYLRTAIENTF